MAHLGVLQFPEGYKLAVADVRQELYRGGEAQPTALLLQDRHTRSAWASRSTKHNRDISDVPLRSEAVVWTIRMHSRHTCVRIMKPPASVSAGSKTRDKLT